MAIVQRGATSFFFGPKYQCWCRGRGLQGMIYDSEMGVIIGDIVLNLADVCVGK